MKTTAVSVATVAAVLVLISVSRAQEWQALVPLKSKCKNVKKLFGIEKCTFPVLDLKRSGFRVNITFANKHDYSRLPRDTVVQVIVTFNPAIKLEDFEPNLEEYQVFPDSDIGNGRIYMNKEKGRSFYVQDLGENELFVTGARLFPPEISSKKQRSFSPYHKYELQTAVRYRGRMRAIKAPSLRRVLKRSICSHDAAALESSHISY